MNSGFKYTLEPYHGMKTRYNCPNCGKKKCFVRYIDDEGNHVGDSVGRCNREMECGYHQKPNNNEVVVSTVRYEKPVPTPLLREEIIGGKYNDSLYFYLIKHFDVKDVQRIYRKYDVRSTDVRWKHSTVFYQIDEDIVYHTGKLIKYDWKTGKRVKKPFPKITWVHNLLKREFELEQCLFGEHLLRDKAEGKIYLVESEKTAIICSLYKPKDVFIATGGLSNINFKKMSVLIGKDVVAIPDKGAFELWKKKLEFYGIRVSDMLENRDEIKQGDDIADLLMEIYEKK